MGLTSKSIDILKPLIEHYHPKSVCDLGAQNLYCDRVLYGIPEDEFKVSKQWIDRLGIKDLYHSGIEGQEWSPPFASEMWARCDIKYLSIDVSEQNGSVGWDLSEPLRTTQEFDFVMDYGTSEHVHDHYQCFKNIHDLTRQGGLMIHENPKTKNWPGHCYHYLDQDFYNKLVEVTGYILLELSEWPAVGNFTDGWNIIAVLQKISDRFPEKDKFPKAHKK